MADQNTTATNAHAVILFDGVCNFCDSSVQFVIRHDPSGHFRFAPLQSDVGQSLLRKHGLDPAEIFSVILIENGRAYSRSSAAVRIARRLSGVWRAAGAFWIIPRPLRDALYGVVAKNRYRWFGKKDACVLPTTEFRARFLA